MAFKKGDAKPAGSGRKKGQTTKITNTIKEFTQSLLDDGEYRESLRKRILSGALPQVELFLLTKALGKPTEHIEVTANVPLFSVVGAGPDEGLGGPEEE